MSDSQNGIPSLKRYERQIYLDIYRLQVEMLNKSSDRRVNVNRYYMYAMYFLVLALSAFAVNLGGIFNSGGIASSASKVNPIFISLVLCGISLLGSAITESWIRNTSGYLMSNSSRENILRTLECCLPDQADFYNQRNIINDGRDYIQLAYHELYAPMIFRTGFIFSILVTVFHFRDIYGRTLLIGIVIALCIILSQSYFIRVKLLKTRGKLNEGGE